MTNEDELAIVDAATDGPWTVEFDRNDQANLYRNGHWIALFPHQCVTAIEKQAKLDAAYIAHFNPARVREMLEELELLWELLPMARSASSYLATAARHTLHKPVVLQLQQDMFAAFDRLDANKLTRARSTTPRAL